MIGRNAAALLGLVCVLVAEPVRAQATRTPDTKTPEQAAAQAKKDKKEKDKKDKAAEGERDTTGRRPYHALFGGASTEPDLTRTVDLKATVSEVYDQNLLADISSPDVTSAVQNSGFYSGLVADLAFNRRGTRLDAALNAGTNARYYADLHRFVASDYHLGGGLAARPSARTQVRLDQGFSYAPVYLLGLFASTAPPALGDVRPPSTDYAVNDDRSYTNVSSGEVTRELGPRADVAFSGSFRNTHYLVTSARGSGFRELSGGGVYRYKMTSIAGLRLGYAYRSASYQSVSGLGVSPSPAEHNVDIGVDVRRELSETRRTAFSMRAGSTIVQAALPTDPNVLRNQLRVIADGSLVHQLGETWQLTGTYRRGTGFVEGLAGPAFTDAWTVSTNGFLTRRADFFSAVAYSTGEASQVGASQTFTTYTGNALLRVGLSQRWAMTSEYVFYFYDFTKTIQLAPGIDPKLKRNLFRVGLSLWMPLRRQ